MCTCVYMWVYVCVRVCVRVPTRTNVEYGVYACNHRRANLFTDVGTNVGTNVFVKCTNVGKPGAWVHPTLVLYVSVVSPSMYPAASA